MSNAYKTLRQVPSAQNILSISAAMFNEVNARIYAKLLQACLTLCDPMDCSPPDSSVHGILQARILEWVPLLDFPNPGIEPASLASPALAGRFFSILCLFNTQLSKAKPRPISEDKSMFFAWKLEVNIFEE